MTAGQGGFPNQDYGENWRIVPGIPPHTDYRYIEATGGVMGVTLFTKHDAEKAQRAVTCVNALKGVPDDVINSDWFRKLMRQFASADYQTHARKAYRDVSIQADLLEKAVVSEPRLDKQLKQKGRLAGLRYAMRCMERIPTARP